MHRHLTSSPIGRKRVWVALPRAPLVSDPRRWVDRHRCRCLDIHWSLHRRSASTFDRDIVVEAAASSRHRTGPCRGHTLSCAACGPSAAPCASWPVPAYRNFARAWPPQGTSTRAGGQDTRGALAHAQLHISRLSLPFFLLPSLPPAMRYLLLRILRPRPSVGVVARPYVVLHRRSEYQNERGRISGAAARNPWRSRTSFDPSCLPLALIPSGRLSLRENRPAQQRRRGFQRKASGRGARPQVRKGARPPGAVGPQTRSLGTICSSPVLSSHMRT